MSQESPSLISKILKISIPIAAGVALMWYLYRDWDFADLVTQFANLDHKFLYYSVLLAMLSHFLRAYRWNLQLNPMGFRPRLSRSYLAVLINYVTNLIFPRAGEVARCASLYQMEKVPVASSFGALISERIIDFVMLILVIMLAFALEFDKLVKYTSDLLTTYQIEVPWNLLYILGALVVIAGSILLKYRVFLLNRLQKMTLYQKFEPTIKQLTEGFLSIGKLEKPFAFWISTIGIWVLYYLMTFIVFFALPGVEQLNWMIGVGVLAVGGIAMALPVQGGIGTYHAMVGGFLVFYGLTSKDGAFFAFVLHTTQTLGVVVFGGIAFFISQILKHD